MCSADVVPDGRPIGPYINPLEAIVFFFFFFFSFVFTAEKEADPMEQTFYSAGPDGANGRNRNQNE